MAWYLANYIGNLDLPAFTC